MNVFASWSGGKDCMLALYRILQDKQHVVSHLVNMCDIDGEYSRSHGLKKHIIARQASGIGIEIVQQETDIKNYETNFKTVIERLKKAGVTGGIFGDIYLQPHRDWIERVCSEAGLLPFFPLWHESTAELIHEFINSGFKAFTVSINNAFLPQSWLDRQIDDEFITDILALEGIDPCAENGEYHSFVYDGPLFKKPVPIEKGNEYFKDNHWFLELT
jgi:diphthine-ammonia ligase